MITWLKNGFSRNTWWSRLIFAGLLPIVGLSYPLCNLIAAYNGRYTIWQLPIDDWIPFNRLFILPYYYWYFQIGIGVAWLIFSPKTGRLFHRMAVALMTADLICAVFYLFMPTYMVRPEVAGQDFLSHMVRMIYTIDLPYNCFPSLHVVWACILCRFWALAGPRRLWFRMVNYTGTILIILSTVFTKQHYTPDIFGGLAVAVISCMISDKLFNRLKQKKSARQLEFNEISQPKP